MAVGLAFSAKLASEISVANWPDDWNSWDATLICDVEPVFRSADGDEVAEVSFVIEGAMFALRFGGGFGPQRRARAVDSFVFGFRASAEIAFRGVVHFLAELEHELPTRRQLLDALCQRRFAVDFAQDAVGYIDVPRRRIDRDAEVFTELPRRGGFRRTFDAGLTLHPRTGDFLGGAHVLLGLRGAGFRRPCGVDFPAEHSDELASWRELIDAMVRSIGDIDVAVVRAGRIVLDCDPDREIETTWFRAFRAGLAQFGQRADIAFAGRRAGCRLRLVDARASGLGKQEPVRAVRRRDGS